MSTHYFTGKSQWAKVHKPDEKYGKYSIDVLLDMTQYKDMKALGLKNNGKPDDSGKMWVTFRRNKDDGAPVVVDAAGEPSQDTIGNGSTCTVKLDVEKFVSKKYGAVTRSTMQSVRIDELVIYDPEKKEDKPQEASSVQPTSAPSSPTKPRIPF